MWISRLDRGKLCKTPGNVATLLQGMIIEDIEAGTESLIVKGARGVLII